MDKDKMYEPLASITLTLRETYGEDDERVLRLVFHLKSGDYFALLATVTGFIEDTLASAEKNEPLKERELLLMRELKKDLMYLQEHYEIRPKNALTSRYESGDVVQ